jgi:predicted DCC family thiol-disulfide oxidoreductase YuxK
MPDVLKILVDGNCIVCDMEVSHYKRMAPEQFEIIDISSESFRAEDFELDPVDVNINLHVIDSQRRVFKGVDAFAEIWARVPHYRIFSRIVRWPLIHQLACIGYWIFTKIRPYLPKKR